VTSTLLPDVSAIGAPREEREAGGVRGAAGWLPSQAPCFFTHARNLFRQALGSELRAASQPPAEPVLAGRRAVQRVSPCESRRRTADETHSHSQHSRALAIMAVPENLGLCSTIPSHALPPLTLSVGLLNLVSLVRFQSQHQKTPARGVGPAGRSLSILANGQGFCHSAAETHLHRPARVNTSRPGWLRSATSCPSSSRTAA
jgi:hypothetical protein